MGRVTVDFAEHDTFGVLDQVGTLPSGRSVRSLLRAISYGEPRSALIRPAAERCLAEIWLFLSVVPDFVGGQHQQCDEGGDQDGGGDDAE